MKKIIFAVIFAMLLAGCGSAPADGQTAIVRDPQETNTSVGQEDNAAPEQEAASYDGELVFVYEGVELIPGAAFDAAQLPEAESVYEVPSCAIEGTDNVYNYGAFEVTAFEDSAGEMIYSIYILDADLATPEGLALGDSLSRVTEIYGEGYEVNGSEYFYVSDGTILSLIVQNDIVISIEYRLDV